MNKDFNIEEFREFYPHFSSVPDRKVIEFHSFASLLHRQNAQKALIEDEKICTSLVYLLLAHIIGLYERGDRLVGTLASASEGSITTSFNFSKNEKAAWFCQSQSGASYYQLIQSPTLPRYYSGK